MSPVEYATKPDLGEGFTTLNPDLASGIADHVKHGRIVGQAGEVGRPEAASGQKSQAFLEELPSEALPLVGVLNRQRDLSVAMTDAVGLKETPHGTVPLDLEHEVGRGPLHDPVKHGRRGLGQEPAATRGSAEAMVVRPQMVTNAIQRGAECRDGPERQGSDGHGEPEID